MTQFDKAELADYAASCEQLAGQLLAIANQHRKWNDQHPDREPVDTEVAMVLRLKLLKYAREFRAGQASVADIAEYAAWLDGVLPSVLRIRAQLEQE